MLEQLVLSIYNDNIVAVFGVVEAFKIVGIIVLLLFGSLDLLRRELLFAFMTFGAGEIVIRNRTIAGRIRLFERQLRTLRRNEMLT